MKKLIVYVLLLIFCSVAWGAEEPQKLPRDNVIMISTWCVKCKKTIWAEYIYKGNSLCPKHFEEEKMKEKNEVQG